ncbi:hypothetical protein [Haloferax volcanii]|uniref:hypothetical protein n=1 Tax=Haloferax volcanii TaxID=2246 RepID=UPI00349F9D02
MPINTDSDEWKNGHRFDWTAVHIRSILSEDEAMTLDEIADELLEQKPDIIPKTVREDGRALKTYLYRVLERQSRRDLVEDRAVTESDGTVEIYYANSGKPGVFPLAEIIDNFPRRFSKLEKELESTDDEVNELEGRLTQLEYQFREEHW